MRHYYLGWNSQSEGNLFYLGWLQEILDPDGDLGKDETKILLDILCPVLQNILQKV